MYGGLLTTTSTVPARSSKAVPEVAQAQVDAGAGQVGASPSRGRARPSRRRARAPRGPRRRRPWRWHRSRCRGRRRRGARASTACSIAQPASSSVSGRGTKTPGPTASSTWRKYARPVRCWSGSRRARRATRASYVLGVAVGDLVDEDEPAPVGAEHVREQRLGVVPGLATPTSARRRTASRRGLPPVHCVIPGRRRASRASRSASTAESSTGWRSPSSTASRL